MQRSFKSKKTFASIVLLITVLSLFYSLVISDNSRVLYQEVQVMTDIPQLKSEPIYRAGRNHWLEFHFANTNGNVYKLSETGLKYSRYKDLMKDIKVYDTLLITTDKKLNIFSITLNRRDYVDTEKVIQWQDKNQHFTILVRVLICVACIPIFLFRKQPMFWHSGFEFEFSFRFLFIAILAIGVSVYIFYNGVEYLQGLDEAALR